MASSADIETAIVNAVTAILYPPGGSGFAEVVSVARGWPTEADIRKAVSNAAHLIGVYAVEGAARDITRSQRVWQCVSPGTGAMEVGRIEQVFRLQIWASDPDARDMILKQLEPALKFQIRYVLPDDTTATLMKLQSHGPDDQPTRADEWAQMIDLTIQYSIIHTQQQPVVTSVSVVETINDDLTTTTQNTSS